MPRSCYKSAVLIFILFFASLAAKQKDFSEKNAIDVVIPCAPKDKHTLKIAIRGLRKNVPNIRRVIVVSKERLTNAAEWFSEDAYPFSMEDLGRNIYPTDSQKAQWFAKECPKRGWIWQQFLKLFVFQAIPGLLDKVLIVDAKIIFLKPVAFFDKKSVLYAYGSEWHPPYFAHMARLLPNLGRVYKNRSGVCHHMIFDRKVINSLFRDIEAFHGCSSLQALCRCIDVDEILGSSFSEYEIYFNYAFSRGYDVKMRKLKWQTVPYCDAAYLKKKAEKGFDYVSFHTIAPIDCVQIDSK